jgi:three-Cys-motif partner protein
MESEEDKPYLQREQSRIKHEVLEKYLERFARIVGSWCEGIIYVDGFSGPWNSISEDLRDSSFAIALKQLRAARDTVKLVYNKDLRLRCIFLEREAEAYVKLREFAEAQDDVDILTINRSFEEAVPELVTEIQSRSRDHFPFILIDPTGWKGFSMDVIAPLIQIKPCEVLVNFMTGHILRFIEDERVGLKASFLKVFGDDSFEARIEGLEGRTREDAIVSAYADRLSKVGQFPYVSTALVLQPTRDRTHFHLVYATRSLKGVEVFKDAEKKALKLSETLRADAKRRARENASGQTEFFGGTDVPERAYMDILQEHFENLASQTVSARLQEKGELPYDEIYAEAMRFPIVQEAYLKKWLSENAEFLNPGTNRTPKIGQGHRLRIHRAK